MKLTKEDILKAIECCANKYSCNECPVDCMDKTIVKESCTRFLLKSCRDLINKPDNAIDIHKIIDEAMEKKDRSVTIFIGVQGTTVNVYPYQETKPH